MFGSFDLHVFTKRTRGEGKRRKNKGVKKRTGAREGELRPPTVLMTGGRRGARRERHAGGEEGSTLTLAGLGRKKVGE